MYLPCYVRLQHGMHGKIVIVIVIVILILIELEEQLYIAIILATKSTRFWVLGPRKAEG